MSAPSTCETHMRDACAGGSCDASMHVRTYELTHADLPSNSDEACSVSHLPSSKTGSAINEWMTA